MDEYDEDEIVEFAISHKAASTRGLKSFGVSIENQEFWSKMRELDKVVRSVQPGSGFDDPFIKISAINPVTGEEWELPPARFVPIFKKVKNKS